MQQSLNLGPQKPAWQPMPVPPDITTRGWHVGTSGYYFDDWIGRFNPPRLPARSTAMITDQDRLDQDRLRFYQKYFSFVEINNTFYQEPQQPHFLDIEKRSMPSMLYTVKVHKDVSHTKICDATTAREAMKRHITAVSPLIETGRFYSFLIQLEDHWYRTSQRMDYLLSVADIAVRHRIDVHIEFRHSSWHVASVLQALKDGGVGICNTDFPQVKHAFPLKSYATTDKGYLRYSGRNKDTWYPPHEQQTARERLASRNARYDYLYSEKEMEELVTGQVKLSKKVTSLAVAFNNHYQTQAIQNAMQNIRMIVDRMG